MPFPAPNGPPAEPTSTAPADGAARRGAGSRILRVDFWRGVAILFIFVNHLPPNPFQPWTTTPHGFSDTAAWFFLLSGVVARLAYGRMLREKGAAHTAARVGRRIGELYVCHLALALAFVGTSAVLGHGTLPAPWWLAEPAGRLASAAPSAALRAALALNLDGFCVNILPAYIVLLALFLATTLLERRFRLPPMVPALALYGINVALGPLWFHGWGFNPLSWQLLFHLGGWVYDTRHRLLSGGLPTRVLLAAVWATLLGCAVVRHAHALLPMPWAYWVSLLEPLRGRPSLGWPYLAHSLLAICALGSLISDAAIERHAPFRAVAALGRKPLPLFLITTFVVFAAYCLHGSTIGALASAGYVALGLALGLAYLRRTATDRRARLPSASRHRQLES